ncbi:MAG TPA: DUF4292 domain-containing protein [Cyclobacteriaceae bacterium]
MNKRYALSVIISLVLFSSCSKNIFVPSKDDRLIAVDKINFQYFKSKAKIKFVNNNKDLKAKVNLRIKKDSVIWASISATLGIEAARINITNDSIKIIDRLNKKYVCWSLNQLSDHYGFNFTYSMIESLLVGNPPFDLKKSDNIEAEKEYTRITKEIGPLKIENFINNNYNKLFKLVIDDLQKKNSLNIDYNNFEILEKDIFPMEYFLILSYNKESGNNTTTLDLKHNKAEISDKELNFPFKVPDKYEKI